MSGLTTDQINWTTKFIGIDVAAPPNGATADGAAADGATAGGAANGADAAANGASGEGQKPILAARGFFDRFRKNKGGKDAKAGETEAAPEPKDKDLLKKLKTLNDAIADVAKAGFDTAQMKADAADFAKQGVKAEAETDPATRKTAIAAVSTRVDESIAHLGALSKSLKEVMGKSKGQPDADQKSKIYKKALEDYYGLTIKVQPGMTSTHFDKVFDMFGTVPKSHGKQDQLKKLTYTTKLDGEDFSGGAYGGKEIYMGDFGDATGLEDDGVYAYELNGKPASANSFNVTTLHEIGHAVDAKNNIMNASDQQKGGYGGWVSEGIDKVTAALVAALKKSATFSPKATDDLLTAAVKTALSAGTVTQPPTIEDDDWQKILPFLGSNCLPIRDAAAPYSSNTPVVVGDRVYTESQGTWYSYLTASRTSTRVNNYQWRSPAEWFAEVYAITWLKKQKPPGAVDAGVVKYCWNG